MRRLSAVSIIFVVAACVTEVKSTVVIARPIAGCEQGDCLERVTQVREGDCDAQGAASPDGRIIDCSDERSTTTAGKALIGIGVAAQVAAAVLVILAENYMLNSLF